MISLGSIQHLAEAFRAVPIGIRKKLNHLHSLAESGATIVEFHPGPDPARLEGVEI